MNAIPLRNVSNMAALRYTWLSLSARISPPLPEKLNATGSAPTGVLCPSNALLTRNVSITANALRTVLTTYLSYVVGETAPREHATAAINTVPAALTSFVIQPFMLRMSTRLPSRTPGWGLILQLQKRNGLAASSLHCLRMACRLTRLSRLTL